MLIFRVHHDDEGGGQHREIHWREGRKRVTHVEKEQQEDYRHESLVVRELIDGEKALRAEHGQQQHGDAQTFVCPRLNCQPRLAKRV